MCGGRLPSSSKGVQERAAAEWYMSATSKPVSTPTACVFHTPHLPHTRVPPLPPPPPSLPSSCASPSSPHPTIITRGRPPNPPMPPPCPRRVPRAGSGQSPCGADGAQLAAPGHQQHHAVCRSGGRRVLLTHGLHSRPRGNQGHVLVPQAVDGLCLPSLSLIVRSDNSMSISKGLRAMP